jgi:hypothetical protein
MADGLWINHRALSATPCGYLEMTMEGEQWTATLYSHIFAIEHNCRRMGPQRRPPRE